MRQSSPKLFVASLVLGLLLIASASFSVSFLVPRHGALNKLAPPGSERRFANNIDRAIDGSIISSLVSEYRVRHDGAYPSSDYLAGVTEPDRLLFYEKVEIKSAGDSPSLSAWPSDREMHIWPEHNCAPGRVRGFSGSVEHEANVDYKDIVEKDSGWAAFVTTSDWELWGDWLGDDRVRHCTSFESDTIYF